MELEFFLVYVVGGFPGETSTTLEDGAAGNRHKDSVSEEKNPLWKERRISIQNKPGLHESQQLTRARNKYGAKGTVKPADKGLGGQTMMNWPQVALDGRGIRISWKGDVMSADVWVDDESKEIQ